MAKIDKTKGPRPVEIVIAGILSFVLGVVGAALFLAFQEPEEVTTLPDPEDREFAVVYYKPGSRGDQSHGTWAVKKQVVERQRSGTVVLIEEELNQWVATEYQDPGEGEEGPVLHISPGTPRFRIDEGVFHVGMPLDWSIFGMSREFKSQAFGSFERRGGQYVFAPERVYVGSMPVPNVFGLSNMLVRRVVNAFDVPGPLREGWANLESVTVDGESLRLVIP